MNDNSTKAPLFALPSIVSPATAALATITIDAKGRVTAIAAAATTGSGSVVLATNPTIVTPTIADLTNMTHIHQSAASGGSLDAAAIGSGVLANARVNWAAPSAIGSTTPDTGQFTAAYVGVTGGPAATELTVVTTSASDPRGIMSAQYSTDTLASRIHLRKARGTPAVPTTIVTGDLLGRVRFSGYDGSNFLQMASIDAVSTGTVASTRVPTYLAFSVATDAAPSVLTERMRIDSAGKVGIGISSSLAAALHVLTTDATTVNAADVLIIDHSTSGLPAASYGTGLRFRGQSNNTPSQEMGRVRTAWSTAIDASRISKMVLSVYSTVTESDILALFPTAAVFGASFSLRLIPNYAGSGEIAANSATLWSDSGDLVFSPEALSGTAGKKVQLAYSSGTLGLRSALEVANLASGFGNLLLMKSGGNVGIGTGSTTPAASLHALTSDAATAAVTDVLIIDHSTSGTPAASYGTGLRFRGQDSTTASQEMGRIRTAWTDPTHLSRASKMVLSTYAIGVETDAVTIDSAGRVGIGSGISPANFGSHTILTVNNPNGVINIATVQIYTAAVGDVGLVVQGNAGGQTGDLQQWQLSNTATVAKITSAGVLALSTIAPLADSTTALKLTKADGTTAVVTVDTTNARVGIGGAPSVKFQVGTGATSGLSDTGGIFLASSSAVYMAIKAGTNPELFFGSDASTYGIFGTLSNHNLGIRTNNVLRTTIDTAGILTQLATDAATAAVTDVLIVDHSTSGTPAASYGTGLRFRGQDSTTGSQEMGRVRTVWTDATHLSRASKMVLSAYNVASEVDVLTLSSPAGVATALIGAGISIVDDSTGRYLSSINGFRVRNGTSTNYVDIANSAITLLSSAAINMVVNSPFGGPSLSLISTTGAAGAAPTSTTMTFPSLRNDGAKSAIIRTGDFTSAGAPAVDLYIYPGSELGTPTQGNLILAHDGTNPRGRVGIGTASPSGLLDVNDDHIRVRTAKTPASAGAAGNQGDIAWDSSFFYICVAASTWKRSAISTW